MAEDLTEIKERVQLAREDIAAVEALCVAYLRDQVKVEHHRQPLGPYNSALTISARALQPIPTRIKVQAGKVANELRATLDNLACCLARRAGNDPGQTTYFPISKTEDIFNTDGFRKMRLLGDADKQTIAKLLPYKGGHDVLYPLHQVDKMRKHQRLGAHSIGSGGANVAGFNFGPGNSFQNCIVNGYVVDQLAVGPQGESVAILPGGAIVVATAFGAAPPLQPNIQVVYEEPEEVNGWPIVPSLNSFADTVETVVMLFD